MNWIILVITSGAFFGIANILDNYLTNHHFKRIPTLIFYSSLLNLLFTPLILLIQMPTWPPLYSWPILIGLAITNLLFLYPYYRALQLDDTSTVVALFSLGKIFVPIVAFLFLDETLTKTQYVGFIIIVIASSLLTIKDIRKMQFNKSYIYMILCCLAITAEITLYKISYQYLNWATAFIISGFIATLLVLPILLIKKHRKDITSNYKKFKQKIHIFITLELAAFIAMALYTYSLGLAPLTLIETVGSFSVFFPLFYAILLHRWIPHFKEQLNLKQIAYKSTIFLIMILAGYLTLKG